MSDVGLKAYAERVYRSPGVEPILLDCQDRLGLDVLCLLGACWLAQGGRALNVEGWRSVLRSHSAWAGQVVAPVRRARRAVKTIAGAQGLYEHLREYELSAEWLALSRLEASLIQSAVSVGSADCVERVLLAYCAAVDACDQDTRRAVARLVQVVK